MTTDQFLAQLRADLGLTHEQTMALLPTVAVIVREALTRDGHVYLGALGEMRLGVQPQRVHDGRVRPERSIAWFRASQTLARAVQDIPVQAARAVARADGYGAA